MSFFYIYTYVSPFLLVVENAYMYTHIRFPLPPYLLLIVTGAMLGNELDANSPLSSS
jgi:hypothetical protein